MTCEVCGKKIRRGKAVGTHVHRACEEPDGSTWERFRMAEYFARTATKELSAFRKHLDLWRRGKLAKEARFSAIQGLVSAIASCDQAHKTLQPIFEEQDV
jgi:hypothetical protein